MRLITRIVTLLVLLASPVATAQEAAQGEQVWKGAISATGMDIPIVVRLTEGEDGWTGVLDVPGQGLMDVPLAELVVKDGLFSFKALIRGVPDERQPFMELERQGDRLVGVVTQSGQTSAVNLELTNSAAIIAAERERRPQTPWPPYPYRTEDVTVPVTIDGEVAHELAGTLTLPDAEEFGPGPYACVVTVSGTGPQDRDETIYEHRPFRIIADHLAKRGIATLRCDDRGVGKSGGDYRSTACTGFAADARAQVEWLLARDEIDPERIGMLGHSEGGLTVPLAAAGNDNVAFVVLLAGMAVRGDEVLTSQSARMFELLGLPEDFIEDSNALRQDVMDGIRAGMTNAELAETTLALVMHDSMGMMQEEQAQEQARQVLAAFNSDWGRELVTLDPRDFIAQLKVPVLAITGGLDTQVIPDLNLGAQREALERAGNEDHTVEELPGLNHLFQNAETGAMAEYAEISESFDEGALKMIGDWIVERFGEREAP